MRQCYWNDYRVNILCMRSHTNVDLYFSLIWNRWMYKNDYLQITMNYIYYSTNMMVGLCLLKWIGRYFLWSKENHLMGGVRYWLEISYEVIDLHTERAYGNHTKNGRNGDQLVWMPKHRPNDVMLENSSYTWQIPPFRTTLSVYYKIISQLGPTLRLKPNSCIINEPLLAVVSVAIVCFREYFRPYVPWFRFIWNHML